MQNWGIKTILGIEYLCFNKKQINSKIHRVNSHTPNMKGENILYEFMQAYTLLEIHIEHIEPHTLQLHEYVIGDQLPWVGLTPVSLVNSLPGSQHHIPVMYDSC